MEYAIWPFAILGFIAFCSMEGLRSRIRKLEDQLGSIKGSPVHIEKMALKSVLEDYIGKNVEMEFRGEQYDMDLMGPGSKCTVLAVDEEWVLVKISTKKKETEKLFRLQQISGIKGIV